MGIWMIETDSDDAGKACLKDRQDGPDDSADGLKAVSISKKEVGESRCGR